jgi:hypothetical protein
MSRQSDYFLGGRNAIFLIVRKFSTPTTNEACSELEADVKVVSGQGSQIQKRKDKLKCCRIAFAA